MLIKEVSNLVVASVIVAESVTDISSSGIRRVVLSVIVAVSETLINEVRSLVVASVIVAVSETFIKLVSSRV